MVKVSCVSYLNSTPFIAGLKQSEYLKSNAAVSFDIPSVCAQKLAKGEVDLGLVPIAIIPELTEHYVVSDYCIGANGEVHSVLLLSEVPLHEIKTILLDFHSKSSVTLTRVLAKNFWKISPEWKNTQHDFLDEIKGDTAAVLIGDRTFGIQSRYKYCYDLSAEWKKFTGLPFVFAAWVANKKLDNSFIEQFNLALKYGMAQLEELIPDKQKLFPDYDVKKYLTHYISYDLNADKRKAMELFLNYINKL